MDRYLELNDIIGDIDRSLATPEVQANQELYYKLSDLQFNYLLEQLTLI